MEIGSNLVRGVDIKQAAHLSFASSSRKAHRKFLFWQIDIVWMSPVISELSTSSLTMSVFKKNV